MDSCRKTPSSPRETWSWPVSLFEEVERKQRDRVAPLPVRMRPTSLDDFVGQRHFIGPGKLLRRLLESDRLSSAIFYGPPGTGKTTLARIIAEYTQGIFRQVNAPEAGVKQVREILEKAKADLTATGRRTVLFIDEIHRFNRAQQDVLLADVEDGLVILIGATTENPFFSVNSPLISRSQIFQFEPLCEADIKLLLRRALEDRPRGMGAHDAEVTEDALDHLATMSDGDARRALSALEVAILSQTRSRETGEIPGPIVVDRDVAAESIQRKAIEYDPIGDSHYDAISAFIKSMRGSDPDATVYWLARMLSAGEDPRFVARRIAICAAEDVGNAAPNALVLAHAAFQVTNLIGMPECQLVLAQAAIYVACAPKSNASATAIWSAMDDVKNARTVPVPVHLRDAHYKGSKRLGYGEDYKYAHDYDGGIVAQDYLGVDKIYYEPTERGHEAKMGAYLERFRQLRESASKQSGESGP